MEERCARHTDLHSERARCAQETCTQHLYHGPALRWMWTRPMALSLTGPPCSLTTAKCSVAPKSAEHQNHAYPGKQGSGCKARRVGPLGMPRSPSTPQPADLGPRSESLPGSRSMRGRARGLGDIRGGQIRAGRSVGPFNFSSLPLLGLPGSSPGQRSSLSLD